MPEVNPAAGVSPSSPEHRSVIKIIGWFPWARSPAARSRLPGPAPAGKSRGRRHRRPPAVRAAEQLEPKLMLTVGVVNPVAPQVMSPLGNATSEILLTNRFALADVAGTVVRVDTNAPQAGRHFYVELFDNAAAAPVRVTAATAQNFLRYLDHGSFDGSLIHRSLPGFVLHGGGFRAPASPLNLPNGSPVAIASRGTIADEIGNPNQRGTIAMAKNGGLLPDAGTSGTPAVADSATSRWFVNLEDNTRLDAAFTAFGRVLGNGLTVVNALAAAPAYNLSASYGSGSFTDAPLWQVPDDGVLRPENFVTVTAMTRAAPGQLVSLAVTSANPALVGARLVGDRLELSRTGSLAGTTTVTVRASAAFDPSDFIDHTFAVTVPLLPAPLGGVIETAGAVALWHDTAGRLFAGSTMITLSGAPVDYRASAALGWRAVAADTVNGVNSLAWQHSSGALHFWRLSPAWAQQSSDGWVGTTTPDYFTSETTFGVDFNGDGSIGSLPVTIESAGSVILSYGSAGNLRANGRRISYNGTGCNFHTMAASGWTVVAADVVGGVNTVVLKHSSGNLHFWRMSTTWSHVSSDSWLGTTNPDYYNAETTFGVDFNGDRAIGSRSVTIESAGSVILTYGSAGNLRANGKRIVFNGTSLNYLTTAAGGWTAMAADVVGGVNTLVLKHSSGFLHFFRMNAFWAQVSGDGWLAPGSAAALATETAFGVDLNSNGTIGS